MPFTSDAPLPAAILEHAIESVATAVSITDAEDRILFVNRYFFELYGYSEEDLPSLEITALRSPRVPVELSSRILPATLDGGWQGILWQKRKDGSEFLVELVTSRVVDESGRTIALIGAARDITEEMRARARQDCLLKIARAVQDASTLNRLFASVHDIVSERIQAPGFTLYLQRAPGAPMEVAYDSGDAGPPAAAALELVKHVVASGRPLRIGPDEWAEIEKTGLLAASAGADLVWLGAPLVAEGWSIGAVVLRNRSRIPYDDKDVELLEYVASQISQAIVKKRVEEDRVSDLSFKTALTLAVSNAGLGIVILEDGRIVYANGAVAALTGYTTQELLGMGSFLDVVHPDEREQVRRRLSRQAQTFLIGETYATALQARDARRLEVEISIQPFALGEQRRYVATLHDVTPLVQSARTDFLTALPNKQAVDEALRREWDRARRRSGALPPGVTIDRPVAVPKPNALLSLLMIDIDRFSTFNDLHGHLAGDETLRRAALVMRTALRGSDFLGRFGGEEFIALLPDTDLAGAVTTGERLRAAVESDVFFDLPSDGGEAVQRLSVTVSVGAASVSDMENVDRRDLVMRADRALYEAKAKGRNCVVAAAPL
jgi:diguanylate cyclase (GGDEF)-like protein/PAS domain S-box-containing protein